MGEKKKFSDEKFIAETPEEFQKAAAFLLTAIPEEFEVEDAAFFENKSCGNKGVRYYFEFIVVDPKTKRKTVKQFNAKKLLRQILKEEKYGRKQYTDFRI
jgi:hypothetical protein